MKNGIPINWQLSRQRVSPLVNTVTSPNSKVEKCVIVGALQCALPPWRRFFIGEHNPTGFTFGFNKEGAVPLNKF